MSSADGPAMAVFENVKRMSDMTTLKPAERFCDTRLSSQNFIKAPPLIIDFLHRPGKAGS
jgi:hypothetical protein